MKQISHCDCKYSGFWIHPVHLAPARNAGKELSRLARLAIIAQTLGEEVCGIWRLSSRYHLSIPIRPQIRLFTTALILGGYCFW